MRAKQIVKKRQRRLNGVDEIVLSPNSKELTTGEISAHFAEIYGASVSKETISRITVKVLDEMQDWAARPLDEVYASIFIDAIVVKVRDGQVANRPIYAAIGVSLDGHRDVLGLWAGTGGEGYGTGTCSFDRIPAATLGFRGCAMILDLEGISP
ncbi:MAG: putative transposase [Rhodococcus sp. (in: high G+C Gram-positive bacteria)]|jgi:putative transposase